MKIASLYIEISRNEELNHKQIIQPLIHFGADLSHKLFNYQWIYAHNYCLRRKQCGTSYVYTYEPEQIWIASRSNKSYYRHYPEKTKPCNMKTFSH